MKDDAISHVRSAWYCRISWGCGGFLPCLPLCDDGFLLPFFVPLFLGFSCSKLTAIVSILLLSVIMVGKNLSHTKGSLQSFQRSDIVAK